MRNTTLRDAIRGAVMRQAERQKGKHFDPTPLLNDIDALFEDEDWTLLDSGPSGMDPYGGLPDEAAPLPRD